MVVFDHFSSNSPYAIGEALRDAWSEMRAELLSVVIEQLPNLHQFLLDYNPVAKKLQFVEDFRLALYKVVIGAKKEKHAQVLRSKTETVEDESDSEEPEDCKFKKENERTFEMISEMDELLCVGNYSKLALILQKGTPIYPTDFCCS